MGRRGRQREQHGADCRRDARHAHRAPAIPVPVAREESVSRPACDQMVGNTRQRHRYPPTSVGDGLSVAEARLACQFAVSPVAVRLSTKKSRLLDFRRSRSTGRRGGRDGIGTVIACLPGSAFKRWQALTCPSRPALADQRSAIDRTGQRSIVASILMAGARVVPMRWRFDLRRDGPARLPTTLPRPQADAPGPGPRSCRTRSSSWSTGGRPLTRTSGAPATCRGAPGRSGGERWRPSPAPGRAGSSPG